MQIYYIQVSSPFSALLEVVQNSPIDKGIQNIASVLVGHLHNVVKDFPEVR